MSRSEIEKLIEINRQKDIIIDELKSQIAYQQKIINQLKDKLNLNSKNSSLPPSKDLYKIRNQEKKKSDRKPGAQPGHTANQRPQDNPNKIVKCTLPKRCECGGKIKIHHKISIHTKIEMALFCEGDV